MLPLHSVYFLLSDLMFLTNTNTLQNAKGSSVVRMPEDTRSQAWRSSCSRQYSMEPRPGQVGQGHTDLCNLATSTVALLPGPDMHGQRVGPKLSLYSRG